MSSSNDAENDAEQTKCEGTKVRTLKRRKRTEKNTQRLCRQHDPYLDVAIYVFFYFVVSNENQMRRFCLRRRRDDSVDRPVAMQTTKTTSHWRSTEFHKTTTKEKLNSKVLVFVTGHNWANAISDQHFPFFIYSDRNYATDVAILPFQTERNQNTSKRIA